MEDDQKVSCNGTEHRVRIDVVTFIEVPDDRFVLDLYGVEDKIKEDIAKFKSDVNPRASVYYDYCCNACKEVADGSGTGS